MTADTVKQGFRKTTGLDDLCYNFYQYSTKYTVHFFGEDVVADEADSGYIALNTLLEGLNGKENIRCGLNSTLLAL